MRSKVKPNVVSEAKNQHNANARLYVYTTKTSAGTG